MAKRGASTRRDFIRQVGAVAAAGAVAGAGEPAAARQTAAVAKGRVIGANDRINVGFVGCGGRMNTHIRRVMERSKETGDVQAVAVNDIWDKRKQRAREATGVDARSVYHDYREVCARPDVDVVVIASPDHWHHLHTMEALRNGKDVYLEKPMTYTIDEAKDIAAFLVALHDAPDVRIHASAAADEADIDAIVGANHPALRERDVLRGSAGALCRGRGGRHAHADLADEVTPGFRTCFRHHVLLSWLPASAGSALFRQRKRHDSRGPCCRRRTTGVRSPAAAGG